MVNYLIDKSQKVCLRFILNIDSPLCIIKQVRLVYINSENLPVLYKKFLLNIKFVVTFWRF